MRASPLQRRHPSVARRGRDGATLAAALVLALAACSSDGEGAPPAETADEQRLDEVDDTPTDDTPTDEDPDRSDDEVEETEPRFVVPGAGAIDLLTAPDDAGPWPTLSWQPVDDAVTYTVTVYAASGTPYWTWRGGTAEVILGGFSQRPAAGSTMALRLHEPMTWDVLAHDAGGTIVAQSGERPIAP